MSLKKLTFTALLVLALPMTLSAQLADKGIVASLNSSTIYGDDAGGADAKIGFAIGGFAEFQLNEKFAARPEVIWDNRGFEASVLGVDFATTFSYLSIPVLASFQPNESFKALVGPSFDIFLSGSSEIDGKDAGFNDDAMQKFTVGLVVGGMYVRNNFGFGARYNFGLSNIFSNDDGDDVSSKNLVLQILASYSFGSN